MPASMCFKPLGIPARMLETVTMTLDEFEALRLADYEGLYQEEAAGRMSVSRPTFGRIVASARRKVSEALVLGKALVLEGGKVEMTQAGLKFEHKTEGKDEKKMKIAVATNDGATVSPHFGRSRAFLVFDIQDGAIAGREERPNSHAGGGCGHHDHAGGEHGPHSHAGILAALEGCEAVLCGGMGWRAAEDLKSAGIKAYVVGAHCPAEEAVGLLITGKLEVSGDFCAGRHGGQR
jgi:predicted DNA-binding protein (UPF0251 family)/predicted Fe-Mo cluster-binding NifX family protein